MNKFLWTIPFLSFLAGYLVMNILYQGNIVTAPPLIGCSVQEALRLAAQKKLNIRLIEEQEDAELPAGTVISQSPSPHFSMKAHQTILCVISKKSGLTVPSLVGKKIEDILKEFKGLSIKIKSYYVDSTQPHGTCIAQDPAQGINFEGKKSIVVYIAQGSSHYYLFPDFKQKPVNGAVDFLTSSGLHAQVIHLNEVSPNHICSDCIVSDQVPYAGFPVLLDANKPLVVQLFATEVEPSTGLLDGY